MTNIIFLDTGATMDATICNMDFFHSVKKAKVPLTMQTNAGVRIVENVDHVEGFGEAWYEDGGEYFQFRSHG